MPNVVRKFLTADVAIFATAALVHAGILLSGLEHSRARIAEGVIAGVLAAGLAATFAAPASSRTIGLWAQGFALLGTAVGLFTIAVGVGPRTVFDLTLHAAHGRAARRRPGRDGACAMTAPTHAGKTALVTGETHQYADKHGPDRVLRIQPGFMRSSDRRSCRQSPGIMLPSGGRVGCRSDGRSPVHTELLWPAETGRRLAGSRVHHAARRLVRQHPENRPAPAPAIHQRAVTTSGGDFHREGKRLAAVFPDAVCEVLGQLAGPSLKLTCVPGRPVTPGSSGDVIPVSVVSKHSSQLCWES